MSCYRYTPHSTGSSAAYDWGEASVSVWCFLSAVFAVIDQNNFATELLLFVFLKSWSHITPEASPWGTAEPSVLYPIIPERLRKGIIALGLEPLL